MSIKIYNPATGEWEVRASNQATLIEVEDIGGDLGEEDVEGSLMSLADKLEEVEFDTHDNTTQIARIDKKIDDLMEQVEYHFDNHPAGGGGGGGGGDVFLPTITSKFEDFTVVDKEEVVYIPIFFSSANLGEGTAYISINYVEVGSQVIKQGNNNIKVGVMPGQLTTVGIYVKDRAGALSNQLEWTIICGGIEVSTSFDFEADYPMGEQLKFPFNIETQSLGSAVL